MQRPTLNDPQALPIGAKAMFIRASVVLPLGVLSTGALAQSDFQALEKEKAALENYCRADIERLCPGVEAGGGRIKECLKKHEEEMSVGCAQALQTLKKSRYRGAVA